jgi:DNA-binding XRE family transcriptional regulator
MNKNMTQYRPSEPRSIAAELRQAAVTRLPLRERQQSEAKDKQRDTLRMMGVAERRGFAAARRDVNARHPNAGTIWGYPAAKFPPRAKPAGKGKDAPFFGMPSWYQWAMSQQSVTPAEFAHWRRYVVNLTLDECAALFRVNRKTIENWERGKSSVPFAVWYVMHCHIQKPAVWLSRCGFTDLYVEYHDGKAYLCSAEYPDIRFTHGQLVYYAQAMGHLDSVEAESERAKARIAELVAENTDLRRMFKGHHVKTQLEAMQAQIGELLSRLHTADVYAFPAEREDGPEPTTVSATGTR